MTLPVKTLRLHILRRLVPCPDCGVICGRHSTGRRLLRDIGVIGPTVVEVTYSKHYCKRCNRHFSVSMEHVASSHCRFTHRVRRTAVELVTRHSLTLEKAAQRMRMKHFVNTPASTIHDWVRESLIA